MLLQAHSHYITFLKCFNLYITDQMQISHAGTSGLLTQFGHFTALSYLLLRWEREPRTSVNRAWVVSQDTGTSAHSTATQTSFYEGGNESSEGFRDLPEVSEKVSDKTDPNLRSTSSKDPSCSWCHVIQGFHLVTVYYSYPLAVSSSFSSLLESTVPPTL